MGTMSTTDQLGDRVRRVLGAALPQGLFVEVTPRQNVNAPAFDITVRAGATQHCFTAGWAGEGWPSDVERLVQLVPGVEVVIAANLSTGAKQWLRQEGLGWVDQTGCAEINRSSGLVIARESTRAPAPIARPGRWNRSMLAVAEASLSGVLPTVASTEQATGLSRHATAVALSRLEQLGHLNRPEAQRGPTSGRHLGNTDAFLDAYAAAAAEHRSKQPVLYVHRLWTDPLDTLRQEIGPRLGFDNAHWAVTGVGASVLLAPYLSDITTLELYVDADLMSDTSELASRLGGRLVDKGHRIEVRQLPTAISAHGPSIDDIPVALPVRVYADLLARGGRSAEAAHHLRESLDVGSTT